MARPRLFGTRGFGSLVTATAPHLLEDDQLQQAANVSRALSGALSPEETDETVYTIQELGNGGAALRYGGADHFLYAGNDAIWEDGVEIGASGGEITHRFLSDGNRAYVFNGSENKVWDGTHLRDHGPLGNAMGNENDEENYIVDLWGKLVVGASSTDPCVLDIYDGHILETGDTVKCAGFSGDFTALNGNTYDITYVDPTHISLDGVDASLFAPFSDPGNTARIHPHPTALAGNLKYAFAYRATLTDGTQIESKLYEVWVDAGSDPDANSTKTLTVAAGNSIHLWLKGILSTELQAWTTEYSAVNVQGILYRTKVNGTDYYEHTTVAEGDILGVVRHEMYDTLSDGQLGALYLDEVDDHGSPPQGDLAVFCQRRLFVAGVDAYPNRLYFSEIDGYEYFPPLNFIDVENTITALSQYGEHVVIFTPGGVRLYSPVDEIGQMSNNLSSVGTLYPDSVVQTELGTLFARDDGLWLFNGVSSERISEPIDPTWAAGSWRGGYIPGHGYYTNGTLAVTFDIVGGKILFGTATVPAYPYLYLSGDPSDNYIWGITFEGNVKRLNNSGSVGTMTVKTKDYGDGQTRYWKRVIVDLNGSLTVTVTTNRGGTTSLSFSTSVRHPVRKMLPVAMIGELANVTFAGGGTLYCVALEAH